jgi:L-threonylcarbamoyladenylate synthase
MSLLFLDANGDIPMSDILSCLRRGEPVGLPSEDGYVIAADATNPFAIARLQELRQDKSATGYSLFVNDSTQLDKYAKNIPINMKRIVDKLWPKSLTISVEKLNPDWDNGDKGKFPMFYARSSSSKILRSVISAYSPLIVSTASVKGWPALESGSVIFDSFDRRIDTVLDVGILSSNHNSTVLSEKEGEIKILREGKITFKYLKSNFQDLKFLQLASLQTGK